MHPHFQDLLAAVTGACDEHYGARLVALAVFGSVGRGTARLDSDVDLLVVADPLPRGRLARVEEFAAVEGRLGDAFAIARALGLTADLSPVFKTPAELAAGTPLMFDMVDDACVLVDRSGVLANEIERMRARLAALGARRVWRGSTWYWDLKPDYRPGEVFEL